MLITYLDAFEQPTDCSKGVAVRSYFVKGGSLVYKADSYVGQIQLSYC